MRSRCSRIAHVAARCYVRRPLSPFLIRSASRRLPDLRGCEFAGGRHSRLIRASAEQPAPWLAVREPLGEFGVLRLGERQLPVAELLVPALSRGSLLCASDQGSGQRPLFAGGRKDLLKRPPSRRATAIGPAQTTLRLFPGGRRSDTTRHSPHAAAATSSDRAPGRGPQPGLRKLRKSPAQTGFSMVGAPGFEPGTSCPQTNSRVGHRVAAGGEKWLISRGIFPTSENSTARCGGRFPDVWARNGRADRAWRGGGAANVPAVRLKMVTRARVRTRRHPPRCPPPGSQRPSRSRRGWPFPGRWRPSATLRFLVTRARVRARVGTTRGAERRPLSIRRS
jgi:hypothetical protein